MGATKAPRPTVTPHAPLFAASRADGEVIAAAGLQEPGAGEPKIPGGICIRPPQEGLVNDTMLGAAATVGRAFAPAQTGAQAS
eukprot:scaffold10329_cov33-Tisochrysis_lutea.AAC.2